MKWVLSLLIWICTTCAYAQSTTVVFAASSLKDPLDTWVTGHENTVISYAGSGTLVRQILQGAPADMIVTANAAWMDELTNSGQTRQVVDVASNRLVIVAPMGADDIALTPAAFEQRLQSGPFAIGFTGAVPAGIYGKAALENLGLWSVVSGRIAQVDNVRAALALVARAEAPLGIVYATDALATDAVRVVAQIDPATHPMIRYQAASLTPTGDDLLRSLTSADGQNALLSAGFLEPIQ